MNDYYNKIEELIVETEANKKARTMQVNSETLLNYWNIGKIITQMQEDNIKSVSRVIKKWAFIFELDTCETIIAFKNRESKELLY